MRNSCIPEIFINREVLANCKFCAKQSDTNEVDEPESRRAQAFRAIPSCHEECIRCVRCSDWFTLL